MADLDLHSFELLTFDCYGTLIDWETGILDVLEPLLSRHGISIAGEELLKLYADIESQVQAGPYLRYRMVLREVMRLLGGILSFEPLPGELDALADSLAGWRPFPDTVSALRELKRHFKLAIISNIDLDLFEHSARRLAVDFDWVTTAEEVGSYKPSHDNFRFAFERMEVPRGKILHVAQSIYHDIVPAKELGLSTVWVNRRAGREGCGATPPADAVPDLEVRDLASLIETMYPG